MNTHPQLSFNVAPHPASVRADREVYLVGAVKVAGSFTVDRDLQAGDELTVQICTADGELIASGVCEAKAPSFKVIELDGDPIGMERIHTIKVKA